MSQEPSTEKLLGSLEEIEQEMDAAIALFDKDVSSIRSELNAEFAAADSALEDFVTEIEKNDDLDAVSDEEAKESE